MPDSFHPMRALASAAACVSLFSHAAFAQAAGGLTLEGAIREAMEKSEEIQILREKENRFKAVKQQAWSAGFPRVSAYANAGRGSSPFDLSTLGVGGGEGGEGEVLPPVVNPVQNRFSYGLQADQSIFSFGRLSQAIRTANVQDRADRSSRLRSVQQLQLQVLDAYYGAVTSKARLGTLESALKRQKETVAFLESNFRMGAGQRSIVLLAVTSLKSLEPERIRAERDAQAAGMALNRLLGRPLDAPVDLDTTVHIKLDPIAALPDSQGVQNLVAERPDIKAMELQRQSLEHQARYLKMQYLPSLGAQGKIGVLAYKLNQLDEFEQNREWQVGVGLNWPLFDGFGFLSQSRQVQSDARSLSLTTRQTRKLVQIEMESAFLEYRASDTALAAAEQAVSAAKEAQSLLSQDFRAGAGRLTDLLQAEESLRQAEFGVLGARYQRIRSEAALRLAMGKGLINEESP